MKSRTIKLPNDVDYITVEEALTWVIHAGTFMETDTALIDESKEGIETELLGYEAVVIKAERGFPDVCQDLGITPRHCNYPFTPYMGGSNHEFSITVDEFRKYAAAYRLSVEVEVSATALTPVSATVAIGLVAGGDKEQQVKRTHKIENRVRLLTAEIQKAKEAALNGDDAGSVWAELKKDGRK